MGYVVGVDFDNTLASYDRVMHEVAVERGLIHPGVRKSKMDVRERVRQSPQGELEWQKLQAVAYGPRMREAGLAEGVRPFFAACRRHNARVYVVSHKTELAAHDESCTNLRGVALAWMTDHRFFQADGMGLAREDVYFESTRLDKIRRIDQLRCTHFIDDLEETFLEDSFPANVERILYAPHGPATPPPGVRVAATWREITDYLFDEG